MTRTKSKRTKRCSNPPVPVVNVVVLDKEASFPRKSSRHGIEKSRRSVRHARNVLADVTLGGMTSLAKAALIFVSAAVFHATFHRQNEWKSVSHFAL